jgi:hypothetical protein
MPEIRELLEKHARWHLRQRALSWAEKIRIAERLMESVRQLRRAPERARPGLAARAE